MAPNVSNVHVLFTVLRKVRRSSTMSTPPPKSTEGQDQEAETHERLKRLNLTEGGFAIKPWHADALSAVEQIQFSGSGLVVPGQAKLAFVVARAMDEGIDRLIQATD